VILAAMVTLGACAHSPSPGGHALALDELLSFANPALCEPSTGQLNVIDAMVAGDAETGFRPGRVRAAPPYSPAFGRVSVTRFEHYTVATVPVRGTLFGLPVVAIEQSLPHGGDPGDTSYRFNAAPELVERVLSARGFPVKLGRTVPVGAPDGYQHFIELIADPTYSGHALLSCGYS
jgi:hypothetical protein